MTWHGCVRVNKKATSRNSCNALDYNVIRAVLPEHRARPQHQEGKRIMQDFCMVGAQSTRCRCYTQRGTGVEDGIRGWKGKGILIPQRNISKRGRTHMCNRTPLSIRNRNCLGVFRSQYYISILFTQFSLAGAIFGSRVG